ncbi:hypothetical protein [Streptomyces sp. NPDC102264]|uniref:hypothetical protein n=1 Tax=Streptomyces sp. NPDC102264 TaxID=3366149 RepID=UPI003806272F
MRPFARTPRRRLATSAMVVLLAVGAAACGGDSENPPAASSQGAGETGDGSTGGASGGASGGNAGDSGESGADSGIKYASCMRDNGVQVKDPKPGEAPQIPSGTPQSVLDKLEKACGKLPGAMAGSGDPGLKDLTKNPDFEALRLKYMACMRKNGYVPPKPNADGSVQLKESPEFTAAQKACKREQDVLDKMIEDASSQGGGR